MTPQQLEALRRLLHLNVPEAARWVAASPERPHGVEQRTWNRWEAGQVAIPDNIAEKVLDLVRWRSNQASALIGAHVRATTGQAPRVSMIWYDSADDWHGQAVLWRPMQSAMSELLAEAALQGRPDAIRLVLFDAQAYNRQRLAHSPALPDNLATRQAWADVAPDAQAPVWRHAAA